MGWSQRRLTNLTYHDLAADGLVTEEEWSALEELERQGVPKYMMVIHWARQVHGYVRHALIPK